VVFFFLMAQILSWLVLEQAPSLVVILGVAFIVPGGVILSLAKMWRFPIIATKYKIISKLVAT
jgi:hypothetical protein